MADPGFDELSLAFEFVSAAPPGENNSYVCLDTGRIYWTSEQGLGDEDVPDDLDTSDRYVLIPHKTELDLGRSLALRFVAEALPEKYDQVISFFRKRGPTRVSSDCWSPREFWRSGTNTRQRQSRRD